MSKTGKINYYIISSFILIMTVLLAGCGQPGKGPRMAVSECAPNNLTVQSNDSQLYLKWDTDCADNVVLSGYYVYLQKSPTYDKYHDAVPPKKIKPFNPIPYPGDTDPDNNFETMLIENLDNGVEYYVSVRTVFPDRTVTVSSNEVAVMCRPEGEFTLDFRYAGLNDGFSFKNGQHVRADDSDNDIYFYHKDGFDFIASPSRLNGFIRESKFYSLGKTKNIYQYPDLDLDIPPVERIPVMVGESYLVETADGNSAKIRIEDAYGEGQERKLRIKYIYQTIKGLMRF